MALSQQDLDFGACVAGHEDSTRWTRLNDVLGVFHEDAKLPERAPFITRHRAFMATWHVGNVALDNDAPGHHFALSTTVVGTPIAEARRASVSSDGV
jgi:hypothetical protein